MTDAEARQLAEQILSNTEQASLNDSPLCVIARHLLALLERTRLTPEEWKIAESYRFFDKAAPLLAIISRLTTQPEAGGGLPAVSDVQQAVNDWLDAPLPNSGGGE